MTLRTGTSVASLILLLSLAPQLFGGMELEAPQYGVRWAVVVGINYDSVPVDSPLPKLKFAESDAKDFHGVLTKNYGFQPDTATLLLGADASRDAIVEKLDEICKRAKEDDCVVIYFSGHGFGRQAKSDDPTQGELLAADVQFTDGLPTAGKIVGMEWIFEHLSKWCKARHKLLILDCCYSGSVFSSGGRGAGVFDASRVDETVYRSPGFQAMTATRELQKVRDGKDGHSPFTDALLKALVCIPTMQKKGETFTTTELFSGMQWFLDRSLSAGQSPRCSWLDGGQGELHFFPEGDFPDPDVPDDQIRKVMLAMVPGSFGNWWFDETPWFMPGLRYEIVAKDEQQRSLLDMISPLRLEQAAIETRNKLVEDPRSDIAMRIRHLDWLLNAKGDEWDKVVEKVMDELQEAVAPEAEGKTASVDPVDLHYLAVLQHATRQKENLALAKKHYDEALESYQAKAERSARYKPLLALCLADRGVYAATVDRDYEAACRFYAEARSVYGGLTPQPFQIYVLCREAEALSRLGRRGAARKRLEEAAAATNKVDPQQKYPLTASLHSAQGWLEMDWREFTQAIDDFKISSRILTDFSMADPLTDLSEEGHEAAIKCMHNDHGIAMALRYLGDSSAAVEMYRALLKEKIYGRFTLMRDSVGRETNYRQTKVRLTERWVNTMERCGDCSLFGQPRDVAEAADDYRRAVRATRYLPPERALTQERRMRQKWALALALPNSAVQDIDLAADQFDEVTAIEEDMPESGRSLETSMAITDKITRLIVDHCRSLTPCEEGDVCGDIKKFDADLADFREYLGQLAKDNFLDSSLSRDDIEAAMFALRVILEEFPDPTIAAVNSRKARVTRRKDIELLLEFCRLGRGGRGQALHFVRPYYDSAIAALIKLEPKDTKQLVEVAWEAMRGEPHFKQQSDEATLVLYCTPHDGYFFLDVPRGPSEIYPLPHGIDFKTIMHASRRNGAADGGLELPPALKKELFAAGDVRLCWRDYVLELGTDNPLRHTVSKAIGSPELPREPQDYSFPFVVPSFIRISEAQLAAETTEVKDDASSVKVPLTTTRAAVTTEVSVPQ